MANTAGMGSVNQRFLVDGQIQQFDSIHEDMSIGEALTAVHRSVNTASAVVCRVVVDGVELTPSNEPAFAALQVGNVERVEVETAHPEALTQDTLKTLGAFLEELISLSRRIAADLEVGKVSHDGFLKLVDGVQTACEAVHVSKKAVQQRVSNRGADAPAPSSTQDPLRNAQTLALLETDLNSILVDLLEAQIAGHKPFVHELLDQHLPANLREWIERGIPALMP